MTLAYLYPKNLKKNSNNEANVTATVGHSCTGYLSARINPLPLAFDVTCPIADRAFIVLTDSYRASQQWWQIFSRDLPGSLAFRALYRTLHLFQHSGMR